MTKYRLFKISPFSEFGNDLRDNSWYSPDFQFYFATMRLLVSQLEKSQSASRNLSRTNRWTTPRRSFIEDRIVQTILYRSLINFQSVNPLALICAGKRLHLTPYDLGGHATRSPQEIMRSPKGINWLLCWVYGMCAVLLEQKVVHVSTLQFRHEQ